MKSNVDQIRQRFDNDVERFSDLETGQSATIDAPLVLDLITAAAAANNPQATRSLDIGCGAGNYTLKLLHCLFARRWMERWIPRKHQRSLSTSKRF